MRTPMIEKIVHTAKQTVKAMVDMARARGSLVLARAEDGHRVIRCSMGGVGGAALCAENKKAAGQASRARTCGIADNLIGSFAW